MNNDSLVEAICLIHKMGVNVSAELNRNMSGDEIMEMISFVLNKLDIDVSAKIVFKGLEKFDIIYERLEPHKWN